MMNILNDIFNDEIDSKFNNDNKKSKINNYKTKKMIETDKFKTNNIIFNSESLEDFMNMGDDIMLNKYMNDQGIGVSSKIKNNNFTKCPICNIECSIDNTIMFCTKCGYEKEFNTDNNKYCYSYLNNHNTTENSFASFKFVGKGSYIYNKSYFKTCSDYPKYSYNNIYKELRNLVYKYEGNKIPKNVIKMTATMYDNLRKKNFVFRGDSKKGIIVACLYYSCKIHNIAKTPKYLCNLTNTPDKYLSQGEKILHDFVERKILDLPEFGDPKKDYIIQYFELLNIPNKYIPFVISLIYRAEKKNIHIIKDSRDTTKCAGAIYMLCSRVPELKKITKEDIEDNCNVSKTTFIRYYKLLYQNYKKIKKTFKIYKIPMPNEWRY